MIPELVPFYDAVKHPMETGNKPVIGYLCSYAPEEIIHAAGYHPMRLFSSKPDIQLAENHLQAYCCSLVRGILEDALAGNFKDLEGMVFPHTCDSIQRLSDIWRMNLKPAFFADLVMPAKLNTKASETYVEKVLERLVSDLEAHGGKKISQADLAESIGLFNGIRGRLSTLYTLYAQDPGIISGKDLFTIVKASMTMEREKLDLCLEKLLSQLKPMAPPKAPPKRLFLSGSVCDMPALYTQLERAGGHVVGDDLCSGQRYFQKRIPENLPPIKALTQGYTQRLVCPAKHRGTTIRGEELVERVRESQADGVIFTLLKFCDPHAFDYPYLKEFLDKAGIRHLHLEMDDNQDSQGQTATRLETFIQMI